MAIKIQIRRDTSTNWTSVNPILSQGEIGFETDTYKIKIGDGSTVWTSLNYYSSLDIHLLSAITSLENDDEVVIADNSDSFNLKKITYGNFKTEINYHTHSNKSELDLVTDGDHDVRQDNPHNVTKTQVGLGNVTNLQNNLSASSDPTVNDDTNQGYSVGSIWINISDDLIFQCVDNSSGAAIWKLLSITETTRTLQLISSGSNNVSINREVNRAKIIVNGSDNRELFLNALSIYSKLAGTTSSQYSAVYDNGDNLLHSIKADKSIVNNCAENYQSSAPSSPVAGQKWINSNDNLTYIYTGSKWLSEMVLKHGVGINSYGVSNQYMNQYDGIVTTINPFLVPVDITLVGIVIWSSSSSSWTGEIRVYGPNYSILTLSVSSAIYNVNMSADVNVDAGTRLSVYMNGSSINHPIVEFYYKWRL